MKARKIYLIRHAEPVQISKEKIYLGQLDLPLSQRGLRQATKLAMLLKKRNLEAVFCSDLLRTRQTAEIIARQHGLNPVCVPELREINLGLWDGRPRVEIKTKYPALYVARGQDIVNFRPPQGESFADLQKRVIPAFEKLLETIDGNLAIIAHAGVNRVILCHLQRLDLAKLFTLRQNYAEIYVIRQKGKSFAVRKYCLT
ncbi:MAG: histidine phosphatase family protein [Firmicutes bacterium]|nr:histidine phosphatase family protein [Bacillota bacterium]